MIEPRYDTLQAIFANRVFRVPHYQRFYSWRNKQREDLFDDLNNLAERRDDNHHFMATMGFREKKNTYERHNVRHVQEVLSKSDWTLADIDEREARIVEFAREAWGDLAVD